MKKVNHVLWGLVLVALGVIWALRATGLVDWSIFFPGWWTLFIIVPSAIGLITDDHKGGSIFGILLGVALMLACLDVIDFSMIWKLILPVAVILIGLSMICRTAFNSDKAREVHEAHKKARMAHIKEGEVVDENDYQEYWATFGGMRQGMDGKEFKDCRVEAVFGSMTLDLTGAKMPTEAVVKVSAIFGGAKIIVPEDVAVEVSSSSIFGGVDNKHKKSEKAEGKKSSKTLYVDATAVFGGVEIK